MTKPHVERFFQGFIFFPRGIRHSDLFQNEAVQKASRFIRIGTNERVKVPAQRLTGGRRVADAGLDAT